MNEAISPISSFLKITLVDGEWICGEQDENKEIHMCIRCRSHSISIVLVDHVADDFELDWVGGGRWNGEK